MLCRKLRIPPIGARLDSSPVLRMDVQVVRMGLLDGLLKSGGDPAVARNADVLTSYESRVKKINDLEDETEALSDDDLR